MPTVDSPTTEEHVEDVLNHDTELDSVAGGEPDLIDDWFTAVKQQNVSHVKELLQSGNVDVNAPDQVIVIVMYLGIC